MPPGHHFLKGGNHSGSTYVFQQFNFFEFDEKDIQVQTEENPCYTYDATFRNESNYKTHVLIRFDGAVISWEIGGWLGGCQR